MMNQKSIKLVLATSTRPVPVPMTVYQTPVSVGSLQKDGASHVALKVEPHIMVPPIGKGPIAKEQSSLTAAENSSTTIAIEPILPALPWTTR
jgi:hypothetical protein